MSTDYDQAQKNSANDFNDCVAFQNPFAPLDPPNINGESVGRFGSSLYATSSSASSSSDVAIAAAAATGMTATDPWREGPFIPPFQTNNDDLSGTLEIPEPVVVTPTQGAASFPPSPSPDGQQLLLNSPASNQTTMLVPANSYLTGPRVVSGELFRDMTQSMMTMHGLLGATVMQTNENREGVVRNSKRLNQLEKLFQGANRCLTQSTNRTENQTKLLAHLVYNGIQTKIGFVALLVMEPIDLVGDVVVASVVGVWWLFKRLGAGPKTMTKTQEWLRQIGFEESYGFSEEEMNDLFDVFCIEEPRSESTQKKRFMIIESTRFFEQLAGLEDPGQHKLRRFNTQQFKPHGCQNENLKTTPSVGSPFWTEIFERWGAELDTFINRARDTLKKPSYSVAGEDSKYYHIHGVERFSPKKSPIWNYASENNRRGREDNGRTKRKTRKTRKTTRGRPT